MSSNFKAATSITGAVDGTGMRIAVVCGRFNDLITNRMLDGTLGGLGVHGVKEDDVTVAWVPGAFEIPVAAKQCAASGRLDAVICLGAVIRGDTAHFEYVAGPCAEGIQQAALETGVPIVFGVLTTENLDQALQRSDLDGDNKGEEAARTALEMVDLLRRLPDPDVSLSSTDALGLLASGVFLVRLLPQPLQLARTGVAAGVSPLSAMNSLLTMVAWVTYGLIAGLPIVWVVSAVAMVPAVWTVLLLRRQATRRDLAWAGAWLGLQVLAATTGLLVAVLATGVLVTQGPQVLKALHERDLTGLAPATWWLSMLDAATWGAYGLAVGDAALVAYGVVLSTSAVIVLSRIRITRRAGLRVAPA